MVNGDRVLIAQNLIAGNVSAASGGGVYIRATSEVNGNSGPINSYLVNNTIVGNTILPNPELIDDYEDGSQVGFGGYTSQTGLYNNLIISGDGYNAIACDPTYAYLSKTPPLIDSSDVFSYTGNEFGGWCTAQQGTSSGVYKYSSAVPMFVSEGGEPFHLSSGSPGVGTGDPEAPELPATDIDGTPRTQLGTSGNSIIDMGVYEGATSGSSVGSPAYTLQLSSSSIVLASTAHYAVSGNVTVKVTPTNGLLGAISLQCVGLPSNILVNCYFDQSTLAAAGDNQPLTTTLRVEDISSIGSIRSNWVGVGEVVSVALITFCPFGLGWMGPKRYSLLKRVSLLCISATLLAFSTVLLNGCSSGNTTGASSGIGSGTGNGSGASGTSTYTLTVTATSTGNTQIAQSTVLTFTISH